MSHPHTQKDTLKNPFPKKHKTEKMENINNKENTQPNLNHNISQSQEAKMEIEENIPLTQLKIQKISFHLMIQTQI